MATLSDKNNHFPSLPDYVPGPEQQVDLFKRIIRVVRGIMLGKTNNTGDVTLTAGSATTDVALSKGDLSPDTIVILSPAFDDSLTPPSVNANTATEYLGSALYVSALNADSVSSSSLAAYSFRITHANNANTDRNFRYFLVG